MIPTRQRPAYLDVALASVEPQARAGGAEIVVVNDGGDEATTAVARRHGARVVAPPPPGGLNAARNAGIDAARADLVLLIDDDISAPPGWLDAVLTGAASAPDVDVFGGPIRARLEGGGPRSCGREDAPITTLDLGRADRDVPLVWGANMALRRRAIDRAGRFDEGWHGPGDEEDWERRYTAAGGVVRYLAGRGARAPTQRRGRDAGVAVPGGLPPGPGVAPLRRAQGRGAVAGSRAAHARRVSVACGQAPLPGRDRDGRSRRRTGARGAVAAAA